MGKHIGGKGSKRMTCRKKYKIARKVREHNKKKRKEAKKNPNKGRKNKDLKVPNSAPFKEEVLKEAEDRKRRLEEERQRQKERRKKQREKLRMQKRNLDSLVADAQKRTKEFNSRVGNDSAPTDYTGGKQVESSLKTFYKEFKKVVDAADVVLEVLDARDPLGSRCPQVESAVLATGSKKRLVLILNKIDLVPKENVETWLKYLRNEFPTVAFKASTQSQQENLSRSSVAVASASEDLLKSSRCLGADMLMKLLGNYCRNKDIKTVIRVGIVGFPNTGKSSIINSLKRSKACNVGAMPGITKSMQEVQLDKHIRLLDSPGIVMAPGTSDTSVILHNCVRIESLEDPVTPAAAILRRCSKEQMMMHYGISSYGDVTEFLSLLAIRQGRLRKRGVPDTRRAAATLLQDWNTGRITYYTHPPEDHHHSHMSAEIVTEMSKEFDIDALLADEQLALQGLKEVSSRDIVLESEGPTDGLLEEAEEMVEEEDKESGEEEMEDDKEDEMSSMTVSVPTTTKTKNSTSNTAGKQKEKKSKAASAVHPGSEQLNRSRKQDFKKMKKKRKRADAVAGKLATAMEDAFATLGQTSGENYDFGVDFK